MSFCLNYLKLLCLAGFILLLSFSIMIYFDVETLKVKPKNKTNGIIITGVTSGVIKNKLKKLKTLVLFNRIYFAIFENKK